MQSYTYTNFISKILLFIQQQWQKLALISVYYCVPCQISSNNTIIPCYKNKLFILSHIQNNRLLTYSVVCNIRIHKFLLLKSFMQKVYWALMFGNFASTCVKNKDSIIFFISFQPFLFIFLSHHFMLRGTTALFPLDFIFLNAISFSNCGQYCIISRRQNWMSPWQKERTEK